MASPRSALRVVLLTEQLCALCEEAKRLLDRLADEYGLLVSQVDLGSAEGQAHAQRGGILFPPGLFLDGEPFSYGRLSERKLRRELDRRIGPARVE